MLSPNFIDHIKIYCSSGKGGAGSVHFRREKYISKGGPDGGNGGRGGHVIIRGNSQYWTLLHLKYKRHIAAEHGGAGTGKCRSGTDGKDIFIEVPVGTVIRNADTMDILFEIVKDQEEIILLSGGRGGLGNDNFKTPTNQAPLYSQPGESAREKWIILELKLLADVGLVGFPNAGKSTLLSVVSAAKPEIADYPFTTLAPNLGIAYYHGEKSFVMADIPGIIEGAAEGKGLGLQFLRHIERNSILLFLIPSDSTDIKKDFQILNHELQKYNPELSYKKKIIGISKIDLLDEELKSETENYISKEFPGCIRIMFSSVSGEGIQKLKDVIWKELNNH